MSTGATPGEADRKAGRRSSGLPERERHQHPGCSVGRCSGHRTPARSWAVVRVAEVPCHRMPRSSRGPSLSLETPSMEPITTPQERIQCTRHPDPRDPRARSRSSRSALLQVFVPRDGRDPGRIDLVRRSERPPVGDVSVQRKARGARSTALFTVTQSTAGSPLSPTPDGRTAPRTSPADYLARSGSTGFAHGKKLTRTVSVTLNLPMRSTSRTRRSSSSSLAR